MCILINFLQRLGFIHPASWYCSEETMVAGVRSLLGHRCPICGGRLEGHRFGSFACFKVDGVDVRDREAAREKLLDENADGFPAEGANDPTSDIVAYNFLECPISRDDVVIEHFSGADVYSEESFALLSGITRQQRERFKNLSYRWLRL
jgi:hypothetical protein